MVRMSHISRKENVEEKVNALCQRLNIPLKAGASETLENTISRSRGGFGVDMQETEEEGLKAIYREDGTIANLTYSLFTKRRGIQTGHVKVVIPFRDDQPVVQGIRLDLHTGPNSQELVQKAEEALGMRLRDAS